MRVGERALLRHCPRSDSSAGRRWRDGGAPGLLKWVLSDRAVMWRSCHFDLRLRDTAGRAAPWFGTTNGSTWRTWRPALIAQPFETAAPRGFRGS